MSAQVIPLHPLVRRAGPQRSLSDQDCFSIAAALQFMPGGWQAQRDEDDAGIVVMTLFPHEDDPLPAFRVRRSPNGLRLQHGTTRHTIGQYGNVLELMRAARLALEGDRAAACSP